MLLLESYEENRKKFIPLENLLKKFKTDEISVPELRLKISTFLSRLTKQKIPIKIIGDKYPQIFVNCHIKDFKFKADAIYVSTSILKQFPVGELVAALLHETYHFVQIKRNPKLIKEFYMSRTIGYVYSLALGVMTLLTKYLQKKYNNKMTSFIVIYIDYILLALGVSTFLGLISSAYFYHKVGNEELLADSYATKAGYGKELVEFFAHYKEVEDMYGHFSLPEMAKKFASAIRVVIQLLKLHPSDYKRSCEVIKQIIKEYDTNVKFDVDLYKWAKENFRAYCFFQKEPTKEEGQKIRAIALDSFNKFRRR